MKTLQDLKPFLEVLGLSTKKYPTVQQVKKAYRDLLYKHPDRNKSGEDTTSEFQNITEATRELIDYLVNAHEPSKDTPNTAGDKDETEEAFNERLLSFMKENDYVVANQDSYTIHLDQSWGMDLVEQVEKKLGKQREVIQHGGLKIKTKALKIPGVAEELFGSVTVTIWLNTKPKDVGPREGICVLCISGAPLYPEGC